MLRRYRFHRVRLIKNHEVISEEDAAIAVFIHSAEQGKEKRVVQNQHVRGKDAAACPLEETRRAVLRPIRLFATSLRGAEAAFRADLRPDFEVRLDLEI